jgi:phosphoribosylanthranilate isomerase
VNPDEASAIISWLEGPTIVGVFKDQPVDEVNDLALICGLQMIQLHGSESLEYCSLIDKPIIKAISVTQESSVSELQQQIDRYSDVVEMFLFDTKVGDQSGGTGTTFDWTILNDLHMELPFIVAGGVSAENVREIIESCEPFGVDVNSSLESEPGVKDFDKMEDFFDLMREIWEEQE